MVNRIVLFHFNQDKLSQMQIARTTTANDNEKIFFFYTFESDSRDE